ncbi:MAG: NAD(+) synthase [Candidatus Nanohaloarchaea archaeon]|nr:NAD(+) synthase [Candidatus Nanohaloarchaea archaeon]
MSRKIHSYDGGGREGFVEDYREDPEQLLRIGEDEAERIVDMITGFYRSHLESSGLDGYAVGLSGGVDSSTTAHLLADAVGPENVVGVIMPADHTSREDIDDAKEVAENLDVDTNDYGQFQHRIDGVVDALEELGEFIEDGKRQKVKRGNILARARMTVLRDTAKARNYLVAGTTNASEKMLGYMTLAADGKGGVDNEALYELFKTTERDLARHLEVPDRIVEKTPSADLWKGQEDREELGFEYRVLDQVLAGFELGMEDSGIADAVGVEEEEVSDIRERVERYRYKREPAPYPSFS